MRSPQILVYHQMLLPLAMEKRLYTISYHGEHDDDDDDDVQALACEV